MLQHEEEVCVMESEEIRSPLVAEMSFCEEIEVEQTRQYWNSPGPNKGR